MDEIIKTVAGVRCSIVSRTDIFRPLLNANADVFEALSVIKGGAELSKALQMSMDEDAVLAAEVDDDDSWYARDLIMQLTFFT